MPDRIGLLKKTVRSEVESDARDVRPGWGTSPSACILPHNKTPPKNFLAGFVLFLPMAASTFSGEGGV